jgi:tetratricopeptide (TPR) repeat protein
MKRRHARWVAMVVAAALAGPAAAASKPADEPPPGLAVGEAICGKLGGGTIGPFDYRDKGNAADLQTVNTFHFNSDVQQLIRGQSTNEVLGDLNFILMHFPNHHRALRVVARYFLEGGKQMRFLSAECYFDRAIRGYPDDVVVRQIYSMYLARKGRHTEAIGQLQEAVQLLEDPSMELHYNLALLYADVKDYDRANEHAAIAYGLGHPLTGLRDRLVREGQWRSQEAFERGRSGAP